MSLSPDELRQTHAYWRAANYLSVGQIYLLDNPLLAEPLRPEHIKPRLLGHWGTTPGLNFVYVHLNRVIKARGLDSIFIAGPGHGGPAVVANAYLEGTYSELYPAVTQDTEGLRWLFRQFSFPGGIPSHAAPETPGSINEGGELGYSLAHAYGAAFDNPDLLDVFEPYLGEQPGFNADGFSKYGVRLPRRWQVLEWAGRRARIASISPGVIDTRMGRLALEKNLDLPDRVARSALAPDRSPDEIASAVAHLSSREASCITGTAVLAQAPEA